MKEQLMLLANEKRFESKMYKELIKHNVWTNLSDNHAYYLWLCELQKWLRDKHDIKALPLPYTVVDNNFDPIDEKYIWMIHKRLSSTAKKKYFDTCEQALEEGLKQALELIK